MTEEEIAALKTELETIKAENATLKAKPVETPPVKATENEDLLDKARKEIEAKNKSTDDVKRIEKSLKFNLEIDNFVKNNKAFLPNEVEEIVKQANKETYDTAADKSNAVKVGLMTSFFNIQANLDALTPGQKSQVEDFQKLSKKGKEEKAEALYEAVFEPALDTFKRIKKAEELVKARSGVVTGSSAEEVYRQKMINFSKKAYLKETNV